MTLKNFKVSKRQMGKGTTLKDLQLLVGLKMVKRITKPTASMERT